MQKLDNMFKVPTDPRDLSAVNRSKRYNNIEFLWSNFNKRYQLVRWFPRDTTAEYCFTVCFFDEGSEGYDMRTVGSRYSELMDDELLLTHTLTKYAMKFLENEFELSQFIKETDLSKQN